MKRSKLPLLLVAAVACLPQVGPPVLDGGMEAGGAGGAGGGTGGGGEAGGAGGGVTAGCPGFAGCSTFTAGATIDFGAMGDTYSPKCLRLTAGQAVTFTGTFGVHPLHQACGPAQVLERTSGSSAQFTLTLPGVYGFYCGMHGSSAGTGMAGAIEVVP